MATEQIPTAERDAAERAREARERSLVGIPVTERRLDLAGVSTVVLEGGDGPLVVALTVPAGTERTGRG